MTNPFSKQQDGLKQDIRAYGKLKKINQSDEFNDFFELLLKTASEKMIWAFTGDNVKTFDDFLKVRGEIIAYLYPIQEVRGAKAMKEHLEKQLESYYAKDTEV